MTTKFMAYPYGKATVDVLQDIYNNYCIACVCDADDKGFFMLAEEGEVENVALYK